MKPKDSPADRTIPDIYSDKAPLDRDDDEVADESPPDDDSAPLIDTSAGFNPYDTGSLYKKKKTE